MNFKKHADRLEHYLEEEFKKELPVALMPDGSLAYKGFRVKKSKSGSWDLYRIGGFKIDSFNLKACALMCAKCYSYNGINKYNEIKILDGMYQKHAMDASIFKYRYDTVKDPDRRDLALWRWELSSARARENKTAIATKFKVMF
jgi:hypothetical protein